MANVNRSRNVVEKVVSHTHRIEDQERSIRSPARTTAEEVATFSVVGDMEVTTSGIWKIETGGQIIDVSFEATDVGTGTTTFDILLDGVALGSGVSVAAGTTSQSDYIGNYRAAPGSRLQWDITAAGMHEKAVVKVRMKG